MFVSFAYDLAYSIVSLPTDIERKENNNNKRRAGIKEKIKRANLFSLKKKLQKEITNTVNNKATYGIIVLKPLHIVYNTHKICYFDRIFLIPEHNHFV